jgi:hypothetical protein
MKKKMYSDFGDFSNFIAGTEQYYVRRVTDRLPMEELLGSLLTPKMSILKGT